MRVVTPWIVMGAAAAGVAAGPACAQPANPQAQAFDIPAGPLENSLMAFAAQSRRQLSFDPALVRGRTASRLSGRFSAHDALQRLLEGSDLKIVQRPGYIVLKSAADPDLAPEGTAAAEPQAALVGEPSPIVDELVVTGSQIRGAAASASEVVSFSRRDMDRAGQATVAEALQALPQAFGGTSTPQTAVLGSDGLGTNFAASTGVNLRGLGSNATLVLVDGRRMAGSGFKGDFADVSAIPTAAVDHVEVLLDGASALYGSDAVGGVVNVILRHDFNGAESRVRYGGATLGGDDTTLVGQAFGSTWKGGSLVLAYEYQNQTRLSGSQREVTADADLRSLGGTDHRLFYSHPANILQLTADGSGLSPAYAVPAHQDGQTLQPGDLQARQVNLENYRALSDILPEQQRHSLYLNAEQELTSHLRASLEARYSRRDFSYNLPEALTVLSVSDANPFFVSPDRASQEFVGYAFGDELGPIRSIGSSDNFGVSAGVTWDFGRSWRLDVYTDTAQERDRLRSRNVLNSGSLDEALGNAPDDPATAFSTSRNGYFNPFGDGGANSRAVLDFVGGGISKNESLSRTSSLNAKVDGTVLALPGGDVKIAVGGQVRRELFKSSDFALVSGPEPVTDGGVTFARSISSAFAELRVPIVGPANARPGLQRLELSLAGRVEDYEDVGLTGDPKFGLIWGPTAELKVRASYGRSFRAPALAEVNALEAVGPSFVAKGAEEVLSLIEYGGNKDLKPETATSWSAGADYKPSWLRGFTLSLTWFDIDFRNRIGQPVIEDFGNALIDKAYAPFVTLVDPLHSAADAAAVQTLLNRPDAASAAQFPAGAYGAIIDARYVNAATLEVQGLDGSAAYSLGLGPDRVDLAINASYLASYTRRLTPASEPEDIVGQPGQPADLRMRGSAGWTHRAFTSTLSLNYTDGSRASEGAAVSAWTTVDVQVAWTAPAKTGPLAGVSLAFTATNVLDADPPFYDSPNGIGYDPANADALGRTVSVQLRRQW